MRRWRMVVLALVAADFTARAAGWMDDESHRIDDVMAPGPSGGEGPAAGVVSLGSSAPTGGDSTSSGYTLGPNQNRIQRLGSRASASQAGGGAGTGQMDPAGGAGQVEQVGTTKQKRGKRTKGTKGTKRTKRTKRSKKRAKLASRPSLTSPAQAELAFMRMNVYL